MIHLVLGYQGSGKTLLLVKKAFDLWKKGKDVISNVDLRFDYEPLDYRKIVDCAYDNSVVIIDEIHLLLPARNSMRKVNREICDGFLSMVRKKNLEVYGTTQTLRKVDIRFREEADYIYECEKYAYIDGQWTKIMQSENLSRRIFVMIKVSCMETRTGNKIEFAFFGNELFNLYDTNQVIKVRGLDDDKNKKNNKEHN